MILSVCKTRTKQHARMSNCYVDSTTLLAYINQAELDVAYQLIEINPELAMSGDQLTFPINDMGLDLTPANMTNLGTGRDIYKIMMVAVTDRASDPLSWSLLSPAPVQEMAGTSQCYDLGRDTATGTRWGWTGMSLLLYPVNTNTQYYLAIFYVRDPVAQTDDTKDMLADFNVVGQGCAELIALRAARQLRYDRGLPTGVVDERIAEYTQAMSGRLATLQMQDSRVIVGTRWQLYADR